MNASILSTLGIVDCAVLLRDETGSFELKEGGSDWLSALIPNAKNQHNFELGDTSLFLADFLIDANQLWQSSDQNDNLGSGIWTEELPQLTLYLEAFACKIDGEHFLIIKNAEQFYFERRETLQIARELSISNDNMVERHDYLNERLHSLLVDNANNESRLPLHEAIRSASIGVIITDHHLHVQDINPVTYKIFNQPEHQSHHQILSDLKDNIERQYPEKDIFTANIPWQGELFFHTPHNSSKWIKVNVNPVVAPNGKISNWIISLSDQTRLKHLLQTNETLALHDPLTGLPNRQYFWQSLQTSINDESPFFLINIDIVNFKNINEVYGYLAGDELLKQVSKRISSELHESDFITRFGADEFMIVRYENPSDLVSKGRSFEEDTLAIAESLRTACEQTLYTSDFRRCELSVKIGLAQYPQDSSRAEELLNFADLALSQAKLKSSSGIELFNDEIKKASKRRVLLGEAIRLAIDNNELEIYLQPIFDMKSGKVVKAEALLRWKLGNDLVMPDEFIPVAENSDMINVLGRWVIARTCELLKQLAEQDIHIPISVNFSPKQIYDVNLVGFIKTNLETMGIDPQLLDLEITEGVLIKNHDKVSAFLRELKQIGLSISVDDFGTGYCSLAYLKNLPIDTLKIDRSFIIDIATDEGDHAIVEAIIALAQKLKLNVIAEGIETSEQQNMLLSDQCQNAQGFLYSKALPIKDFMHFIKH
ncbi:EAL domain-containing protein [Glaciecola sp. 2405UD65-10]|uniref:sensor domain-containing protein n=1 Tax=Glaciecola sp. 2405UD65-10 TaxID=3397244 RepID=UPI003B5C75A0